MARNPVTPVIPVDAVGKVRRVDKGSTYFRHLELWRIQSEFQAAERHRPLPAADDADDFRLVLAKSGKTKR